MTGAQTAALLAALRTRSGFASEAVPAERVAAYLAARARELGLADAERAAVRALRDDAEFARIEAHFSPPETWLFRYPESFEHVRAFARARARAARGVRALVAGAGGWCEPCSLAAALLDGAGDDAPSPRVSVEAIDRNPAVFARPAVFHAMDLRSGIPAFAQRFFVSDGGAWRPTERVLRAIATRATAIEPRIAEATRAGERFDLIAFRNVAIYLDQATRAAIFSGLASLLADDGMLLVGHAESGAAAQATGLSPDPAAGAFALVRATAAPAARRAEPVRAAPVPPAPAPASPASTARAPERALDPEATVRAQIAGDPTDPSLHLALARLLEGAGDLAGAHAAVGRALYLDRNHEEALVLAARIADARGSRDEAEHLRARALRIHLDRMGAEGGA